MPGNFPSMTPATVTLSGQGLTLAEVVTTARNPGTEVRLDPDALARVDQSREVIDRAVRRGDAMYGINTGFGKLANVRIDQADLERLQANLIRSHAAGVGDPLPRDIIRAMMLLRANVLLRSTSGVRRSVAEALVSLLNADWLPVIPEQGSVGASGDLAPLSHLALALMGEGSLTDAAGVERPASDLLADLGIPPLVPGPKEGLAFINGTQVQTASLALLVHDASVLWHSAVGASAMSLEALRGTPTPFDSRIHLARPHPGQHRAATMMRELLADSPIRESHREGDPRVQDAYSLRCSPQVMGPVWDAIVYARNVVEVELNASTDNPLVFGEEVLSGGNFHGQPVAQAMDFLAIALTTLQAIAERRVERLVNPDLSGGLPAFLTETPGVSSGFMMVQITAASLVAESRSLAYPASIGSIPTDANQEDFVPMGMAAAYKARRILRNAQYVVAAEFLSAAQGLEFLKPLVPGAGVRKLVDIVRSADGVPPLDRDRSPAPDLERIRTLVSAGFLAAADPSR